VKIASQRLHFSPLPNPCALRALCGESLHPFRITHLQIPFLATPFLSHPCKTPGVSPFVGSVVRTQCPLRCAVSCNSFVVRSLQPLTALLALFFALSPFVFNHFQPLFPKCRGGGVGIPNACTGHPGGVPPSKVGRPFLAVLRRPPTNPPSQPNGGPMTSKPTLPSNPPSEYLHFPLRTSNPCSPKWSIIPAPASATRLRGRSV